MLERENDLMSCALSWAFHAIGGKWKPYIIWYLSASPDGICRYGELKRSIPFSISHKMFAQQLKEMEDDGVIIRTEYDEKPIRVEYELSEYGKFVAPVIQYLRDWGAEFNAEFPPSAMVRTLGNWESETISYKYIAPDETRGIEINFNLGRRKE